MKRDPFDRNNPDYFLEELKRLRAIKAQRGPGARASASFDYLEEILNRWQRQEFEFLKKIENLGADHAAQEEKIKALEARESGWISVKDRLPEKTQYVLVASNMAKGRFMLCLISAERAIIGFHKRELMIRIII